MSTHSQAPFAFKADRTIHDAHGTPLARCYADRNEAANGPLFAAAPELLAASKRLLDAIKALADHPANDTTKVWDAKLYEQEFAEQALAAAIAKATGAA